VALYEDEPVIGLYLAAILLLIGVTTMRLRSAVRTEGWKLLVLIAVPVPWLVEIVLGQTHQFGHMRHGPAWVPTVIASAAFANVVLWVIVLTWLWRGRRCVVPFIAANVLIMPLASLVAGCDWAGACF
jgi:hypothetical protein